MQEADEDDDRGENRIGEKGKHDEAQHDEDPIDSRYRSISI